MDDLIDKANARQAQLVEDEIQATRKHVNQAPISTGFCLYCEEPLEEGIRFCDKDCAEDAEKYGTYQGGFIPLDDNTRIKRGTRPAYLRRNK